MGITGEQQGILGSIAVLYIRDHVEVKTVSVSVRKLNA